MTTWNFRIIYHDNLQSETYFGIHEVFYDGKGRVTHWTETPTIVGDTLEDLAREVDHMIRDLDRYPNALVLSELLAQIK